MFCIPNHYTDAVGSVLIPHGMIQDRIEKLGRDVFYDMLSCEREPLHALCVLKGGYKFFSDMLDKVFSKRQFPKATQLLADKQPQFKPF